jgi:hypothetical protein
MKAIFAAALLGALAAAASAEPDHEHAQAAMPKEFEALKPLVGAWEGTAQMGGQQVPVVLTYALTSGGTAIIETLMAGTPHEMVSVYHKAGDKVSMTHYCALGNSPTMALVKSDGKCAQFEMTEPKGVASIEETHMHGVTLTLTGPDTLRQEWEQFEGGKKKQTMVFEFKRKS